MLSQTVVIATEAEDEVAGLSDVDAISDVLKEEGEAFPSSQRRHVALGQSQMSAEQKEKESLNPRPAALKNEVCTIRSLAPLRARLLHQQSDEGDHLLQSRRTILLLRQRQDVFLLILLLSLLLRQHLYLRLKDTHHLPCFF